MSVNRVGGVITVRIDSEIQRGKGSFTVRPSMEKKEAVVGNEKNGSAVHGYKSENMVPFIEGTITDNTNFDIEALIKMDGVTATVELATGKTFILRNSWYAGEGELSTEEGEIQLRLEGSHGEFIKN